MPYLVYLTVICTDTTSKTGTSQVEITVTVSIHYQINYKNGETNNLLINSHTSDTIRHLKLEDRMCQNQ